MTTAATPSSKSRTCHVSYDGLSCQQLDRTKITVAKLHLIPWSNHLFQVRCAAQWTSVIKRQHLFRVSTVSKITCDATTRSEAPLFIGFLSLLFSFPTSVLYLACLVCMEIECRRLFRCQEYPAVLSLWSPVGLPTFLRRRCQSRFRLLRNNPSGASMPRSIFNRGGPTVVQWLGGCRVPNDWSSEALT